MAVNTVQNKCASKSELLERNISPVVLRILILYVHESNIKS